MGHVKFLKLFILFYLLAVIPCFSSTKKADTKSEVVLNQYNNYLATVHLNKLVKATGFGYREKISQKGPNGLVERNNVYVLTLTPDSVFDDQFEFRAAWEKTLQVLNGKVGVYQQLFFQLADAASLQPGSLVITIQNQDPEMSLYLIYFDGTIKVVDPATGGRGKGGIITTPLGPDDLNNVLYSWFFKPVVYSKELKDSLKARINRFLLQNKGKNGKPVKPDIDEKNYGIFFFEVKNAKAVVTPGYFEVIKLNLFINLIPATKNKPVLAAVSYLYSVQYSKDEYTGPATPENSENVVVHYKEQLRQYGDKLFKLVEGTVH